MSDTPLLDTVEHETGPNPRAAVIWLHGLGADGYDFAPIVPELDLAGCPPTRFVFPHAPMRPVTINNGFVMRAWYDILGVDLARREDEAGLRASSRSVEALIERETRRGVPASAIVLAGFSQGSAMALLTGLRQPQPLAGLIGLSGYLPLPASTAAERHPANARVPIFLGHGSADPIVPMARGAASRDLLQTLGYPVEWHEYPMPHAVCEQEIEDVAGFLRKTLTTTKH